MARAYAQLHHTMWKPGDFRDLSPDAKLLYIALMSQAEISPCGLLSYNPTKWALVTGQSDSTVRKALGDLEAAEFVVVDVEECELLVRTYMKYDQGYKNENRRKGIHKAILTVSSGRLKGVLKREWERLGVDFEVSTKDGPTILPSPFEGAYEGTSDTPSKGYGSGSGSGSGSGLDNARAKNPNTDEQFEDFWAAYPRSEGKQAAVKAWAKASKLADQLVIVAAARRYRDDPNREDAYTKHASTWLNGRCWDDPPLPARSGRKRTADDKASDFLRLASELGDMPKELGA